MEKITEEEQIITGGIYLFFLILGLEYIILYLPSKLLIITYLTTTLTLYWLLILNNPPITKKPL